MAFVSALTLSSTAPFLRNKKDPLSSNPIRTKKNLPRISCAAADDGKIDRRDILVGLSGLYGASTLSQNPFAFAEPVQTPIITNCGPPILPPGADPTNCCPPPTTAVIDYTPPVRGRVRVRPAAHLVDKNYIKKYKRAVELMKALPASDPRSFTQQANIHCAYCNGAYKQVGFPVELQVHDSWLFFPFHRFYLHFHERILGELINDPTFALPFWNYDTPAGMTIPSIYADRSSPLYDPIRNRNHFPPAVINLDFGSQNNPQIGNEALRRQNLTVMYRQMVSSSTTPSQFFGKEYLAGQPPSPGAGTIEKVPHGPVHVWCGDNTRPNHENMGNFYSAARDPIFYAHHANIDRFWSVWKTLGGRRKDLRDRNWLDASFIFYDEKARAVRVRVRQCLDSRNLGYTYQDVPLPWLKSRPTSRRAARAAVPSASSSTQGAGPSRPANINFPITLNSRISTEVKRPRRSRSKKEKGEVEEILVIDGIEFDSNELVKIDVLVNDEDDTEIRADNTEFAGSFVNVPHMHGHQKKVKTALRLGLTELLDDLDADNDDSIIITLVPVAGTGVTVDGIKIEFD